jgi:hypothetical protein
MKNSNQVRDSHRAEASAARIASGAGQAVSDAIRSHHMVQTK